MSERFEQDYWERDSHYKRFGDYKAGLEATMGWYQAFVRFVDRLLPRSGRHLDIGCGHGAIVHLLDRRGLESHGIDVSEFMIEQAKEYEPRLAARFAVASVEDEPPFPRPFDVITCLEVLEHLEHPREALAAMARNLAPGGILIATTPNPANRFPRNDPSTSDPTHISLHEPAWWRQAAEEQNLEVRRSVTYFPVPLLWRANPRLGQWIPLGERIGPGYLLAAELN